LTNHAHAYGIKRTADYDGMDYLKALSDDRERGIDGSFKVMGTCGMSMSFSEKCLSYDQSRYNSVTIELHNDSSARTPGDWHTIRAELYLVSYLNEDGSGLDRWMLLDMAAIKLATAKSGRLWREGKNAKDGARASFAWLEANDLFSIAPFAVLAQSGMLSETNAARLAILDGMRHPSEVDDEA